MDQLTHIFQQSRLSKIYIGSLYFNWMHYECKQNRTKNGKRTPNYILGKQNGESIGGYSKSIVRKNNDKFGKRTGLNK